MGDGDNGAHHVQHHQLIHTAHKEGDEVAGDHLTALGPVQDLAAHQAQQHGDGNGDDCRQDQTGDAPDLPVGHQDQADLTGHGAQGHTKVQTHTGHDGDQQAQDHEGVAAQAGHDFIEHIAGRKAGQRDHDQADDNKQHGHRVVADNAHRAEILPFSFHAQRPLSVFLVRAYRIIPLETTIRMTSDMSMWKAEFMTVGVMVTMP